MNERTEYWWVRHDARIQPAAVGFIGGIPAHIWTIGSSESITAASAELLERLPAPPILVFESPRERPPVMAGDGRSNSLFWLVGILLLILVFQFSGMIFDALK